MNITIDPILKQMTPQFAVGVIVMDVVVGDSKDMDAVIHDYEKTISQQYNIEDVVQMDIIKDGRDAYKTYGKDPSRYRLATESLFRRVVKGNPLYRINNVVDAGNVLSLHTRKSTAVLDYDKIQGDVLIRLGTSHDDYEGIGRGKLNVESIPLYEDDLGPFGSTTSDTLRTMITNETTKILLFIISFSGSESLSQEIEFACELYNRYCDATILETSII